RARFEVDPIPCEPGDLGRARARVELDEVAEPLRAGAAHREKSVEVGLGDRTAGLRDGPRPLGGESGLWDVVPLPDGGAQSGAQSAVDARDAGDPESGGV